MAKLDVAAIVRVGGRQVMARPRAVLRVARRPEAVGKTVSLDEVLLLSDEKEVKVGRPLIKDARVVCEVKAHGRDPKIIVFRFRRRESYRRKTGHRQNHTDLLVKEIKTRA